MNLSVIVIGDEILLGQVTDTNSGAIARAFGPLGWQVRRVVAVPDDSEAISDAVNTALDESQLVITTGGLGPTKDDITKHTLMEIFGGTLRRDPDVTANIRRVFDLRGLEMNPLTADQALVPDSCRVIQNLHGTAPVMWFERDGRVLVSMPGVPFETERMLPEVTRQVRDRFAPDVELHHRVAMASGITESALAAHLSWYEDSLAPGIHLAYLPQPGLIRLRLDGIGCSAECFDRAWRTLLDTAKPYIIHIGDATPAAMLIEALRVRGLTMATAESCTGGNIAHAVTSVAGASDVFLGAIVSYANSVKSGLLGVSTDDLAQHGAVSEPVVRQMALGACHATGADCAVATSGIAGPGGGTPEKPVGTVWMAWCVQGHVETRCFHFPGDRARVINRATSEALLALFRAVTDC